MCFVRTLTEIHLCRAKFLRLTNNSYDEIASGGHNPLDDISCTLLIKYRTIK